jgi:DNA primase
VEVTVKPIFLPTVPERKRVGFFAGKGSMHDRIVIPIHNSEGELVAYAGRSIDGSEPRYKFPAGFHKSLELFNLHRVRREVSVVLVEG